MDGDREYGCNGYMKTWVEEKGWRRVKERLPRGDVWKCQLVGKKNKKKGRARRGIIMGIRKHLVDEGVEEDREG